MDIPKRLESLHGLILSYISWEILYVCMQQSKRTPKVRKTTFGVYFSSITKTIAIFLLEPAKNHANIACIDCSKERDANTYRGSSNLTSSVLVKLWSKFSAKWKIVQNDEKTTVFKGFKPQKRSFLPTNAIFDTGCIGLQSCIEMQPKKCMQPTDKLEFVDYIGVPTSIKLPG